MARLNPLSLKRPGDVEESATFTDLLQPGQELALTLKASASAAQDSLLTEQIRDLATLYVTGDAEYQRTKDDAKPKGSPPVVIMDNDTGKPLPLSFELCVDIALLMQAEELGAKGRDGAEEPYSFGEWVYFADRMPTAFEAAVAMVKRLRAQARGGAATGGNAPGESGRTGTPE